MCGLTTSGPGRDHLGMGDEQMIFPRSPLERMNGWMHLPRLVDKIRLNEAGRLGADYLANFLVKGFDQRWLAAAEIESEALVKVVKESSTDGEVCDWVSRNVRKTEGEKERFNEFLAHYGREGDDVRGRLQERKEAAGMADRADIQCFVDFIDAEEGRI